MALSKADLDQRARERAADEGLHTFRLAGSQAFLVKSRKTDPGAMHVVTVDETGTVTGCSHCPGWDYRRSCVHAAAMTRRLERERRGNHLPPVGALESSCCGRSQLYREED
jgi:hypothetical protein